MEEKFGTLPLALDWLREQEGKARKVGLYLRAAQIEIVPQTSYFKVYAYFSK